jgi:hypothetical protein
MEEETTLEVLFKEVSSIQKYEYLGHKSMLNDSEVQGNMKVGVFKNFGMVDQEEMGWEEGLLRLM